jgi:DNA-binding SARP family transcriptional activator
MREQAESEEDLWGAAIIRLLAGIVGRRADILVAAAAEFGQLDAPVLELWATSLAAACSDAEAHLVQARITAKNLDARAVPAAAQDWAELPTAFGLPSQRHAELRLLGGFELSVNGVIVDVFAVRPRARKALHVLALHVGRPVHRDVLAEAVWPDSDPDAARRSVHVAISSLRHLLEPEAQRGHSRLLPRLGDTYTLSLPDGSRCDHLDFQEALVRARAARVSGDAQAERVSLRSALDCYGGDLLPEDGSAEWLVAERERLRLAAADASEQLARAEAASGDVVTAVEQARRALSYDSYRDSTWRLLIQLHERAGDLSAVHAVRQKYAKMLGELDAAAALLKTGPVVRPARP